VGGGGLSVARLPLLPKEASDPVTAEVFETFAREGRDPIALYRVLAHSPLLLRAYSGLAQGLRYEAQAPRTLRELMILRTAQLTSSQYEWAHHRAMAQAAGVPEEQVQELAQWRTSDRFDERERAALGAVEGIHEVALGEQAFAELERTLGAAATVELVLLSAFYQAVARVIQAFGLEVEPEYQPYRGGPAAPPASAGDDKEQAL
jgi:4-carboxymuconolactone decarboxylase